MALRRPWIFLVVLFVIFSTSQSIAQTTANQPPALSSQGAPPGNASPSGLEQEINSEVAEAGNSKASLGKLCTGGCAERLAESGHDNRVQRMEVE